MDCATGGFPTLIIMNLGTLPQLLCQKIVAIEPVLQPLSGEVFHYAMANVEDEARLDQC